MQAAAVVEMVWAAQVAEVHAESIPVTAIPIPAAAAQADKTVRAGVAAAASS